MKTTGGAAVKGIVLFEFPAKTSLLAGTELLKFEFPAKTVPGVTVEKLLAFVVIMNAADVVVATAIDGASVVDRLMLLTAVSFMVPILLLMSPTFDAIMFSLEMLPFSVVVEVNVEMGLKFPSTCSPAIKFDSPGSLTIKINPLGAELNSDSSFVAKFGIFEGVETGEAFKVPFCDVTTCAVMAGAVLFCDVIRGAEVLAELLNCSV